ADPAVGRLVKADHPAMFRVGYSTQVQHTPNGGLRGRKTGVTFPCGSYKPLSWLTFLHAAASFRRSERVLQQTQIRRQRRLPAQNFPGSRVLQGKQSGMQRLPAQGGQRSLRLWIQRTRLGLEMRAIDR